MRNQSIHPLCLADEHLAELMPIFERLRQQEQIPCAFPLHMGAGGTVFLRNTSRSTPLSPHVPHCHPPTHWVSESSVCSLVEYEARRTAHSCLEQLYYCDVLVLFEIVLGCSQKERGVLT